MEFPVKLGQLGVSSAHTQGAGAPVASCSTRLCSQLFQHQPTQERSDQQTGVSNIRQFTCSEGAGRQHCNPGKPHSPSPGAHLVVNN